MPKISKASRIPSKSTKPGSPPPEKEKIDKYICTRCGKIYVRQKSNFPASQSPLYKGGGGYTTVCYHCMDNLYDHYKEVLGNGKKAMERICMKFDMYWNPSLYDMINKMNTSSSRVRQYISKTFLIKYIGKSYDDTLDEQHVHSLPVELVEDDDGEEEIVEATGQKSDVDVETIMFWGIGFDAPTYKELDMRYERWTKDLPKPLPIVDESLYKQICIQEMMINRNIAANKDIEKGQSALSGLLGSLNVKPSQQKEEKGTESDLATTPIGVWAKRWEDKRPIPEYKDEISEPNIVKYITTWFYGHIAKALGLKNMYSQVYEDEIAKYRVKKPEFDDDENDDVVIEDLVHGGDAD